MRPARFFVAMLFLLGTVDGFINIASPAINRISTSPSLLYLSSVLDDSELEELTPQQIKTLRKEASKRQARKQLATVFLDRAETEGPFASETLQSIGKRLEREELVQVRGIAVDEKRNVKAVSERLALEVSMEMNNDSPVFVVDIKGHAAILFCANGRGILLRTTLKANQWDKRPRKPRDNSGQIIR